MRLCCCLLALVLVNGQGQEADDFDFLYNSEEGLYEFIYRRGVDMLWVVHNEGCYFSRLDDRYSAGLLSAFSQNLLAQVMSAMTGRANVQPEGTTEEEVRYMFHDPQVQSNVSTVCGGKDFYLIYPDIFQCDFELSTCAWTQNLQTGLTWQRHSGSTATALTGPEVDHTLQDGTGHYLYVESSLGSEGQMTEIISPTHATAWGMCLRFWYNMYGEDVGRLHAFYQDTQNPSDTETVLDISGDQGRGWYLAEMTVTGRNVQVHIQALVRDGQRGDIAIDDISSTSGLCSHTQLRCHFEATWGSKLCHWSQTAVVDDMQWTLGHGETATAGTGPNGDLGQSVNGTYLYIEGNEGRPGDTADLESPLLEHQAPICLYFHYYMWGSGVGELAVIQRVRANNKMTETVLWNRLGEQGRSWHRADITIAAPDPDTSTQIVIRATRGSSAASDIAIDAIHGETGVCKTQLVG